jgi:hypothetical protein
MGSSQNDGYAQCAIEDEGLPASSPPAVVWIMESESEPGEGMLADVNRDQPPPVVGTSVWRQRQRATLEVLQERLGEWCQVCPACVLAGRLGLIMINNNNICTV